jgi:adenylosuccinate synthase
MTEGEDRRLGDTLRELGHEYGVTTGRPRRIGYLDLVALKYAAWVNSLDGFILSHLNLYDGFDSIGVCTAYELEGEQIDYFPSCIADLEKVRPVLQTIRGWEGKVADARSWDTLPAGAREFVELIENFTGTAVHGYSVGPLRDQTFMKVAPWTQS